MDHRQLYYFMTLIAAAYSCQDPWTIESPMIKPGTLINFKNSSSVGNAEILIWTWVGQRGEIWENRIWHVRSEEQMGGSFLYKERVKHTKNVVQLEWERKGSKINWNHDPQMIKQPGWRIVVRDVVEVNFIPLTRDWVFKVGEDQLFGTGLEDGLNEDREDYDGEDENDTVDDEFGQQSQSRKKRSPQESELGSQVPTEAGFGDWMRSIYDYFMGKGDTARNEPEGIFRRVWTWLREMSCNLGGPCDQPVPGDLSEGPIPAPTIPSMTINPPRIGTISPEVEILADENNTKK